MRHYTRLSRQNYAIDLGLFPLGSCTMKHNPRLNEKVARMPGFADVHPLAAAVDTVQGALGGHPRTGQWLITLTGMARRRDEPQGRARMASCAASCAIKRRARSARRGPRASSSFPNRARHQPRDCGLRRFPVEDIPATAEGRVDLEALKARLGPDVAG